MQRIHQLVAGYSKGDAISNEARKIRGLFLSLGAESEIFCEISRTLPELRKDCRDIASAKTAIGPEDVVILHLSIGSEVNDVFPALPGIKVIRYHNITPAHYFRALNDHIAHQLERGRHQLKALAGTAVLNMADSEYNAQELREAGYENVHVSPLVLELKRLTDQPNAEILETYADGMLNILFVGRCAPNKRLEDLLHAFYYVQKYVEPRSRLLHVGSFAGTEQYLAMLKAIARDLDLKNVNFVGSVPEDHLCAYYKVSDVFLCMSEHEGFGIPLLEAMQADIPVLAYASAAVPETMGGAGLVFHDKLFDELAEWIVRAGRDAELRQSLLQGQQARIRAYETSDPGARLLELLSPWLHLSRTKSAQ
ncbi:MAG: glycosyltransferase [Verrucomicrobia bacterium]|nr:glycosyltransferase [Verrucomicrobiota bacterium]MCH8526667.1 glycosyltransferase [Kiritimatiellia bacterium]